MDLLLGSFRTIDVVAIFKSYSSGEGRGKKVSVGDGSGDGFIFSQLIPFYYNVVKCFTAKAFSYL